MRRWVAGLMVLRSPLNNNMECSMCGLDDPFVLLIMTSSVHHLNVLRKNVYDALAVLRTVMLCGWIPLGPSIVLHFPRDAKEPFLDSYIVVIFVIAPMDSTIASAKISYPNDIAGQRACSYNCLRHVSAPRFRTGIESVPEAIVVPVKDRSGWLAISLAAQAL
ncbi:hypothetical protein DFP72DRAFT_552521 [Ephemerocybe angulata]|uniref:Uncharacterized protein n=1 Tax=Ephemerocybe angulata TaxID=980116 RepID=A0A8H6HM53_9AGAR|nr:hypothetical protein DFP72DRAFT_552521 [Tulosesus angulatus]